MMVNSEFTLPELSKWRRNILLAYASKVLEAQQQMLTSKNKNIVHYTLKKKRRHERMTHYPKGDRIDRVTGAQYFYHCHREDFERHEHGHFHCFLRYKYIPKSIKPTPLADWDKYIDNPMTHCVGIAMNQFGQPIRLFTVNRWVTSEIWYDAIHTPKLLKRFKLDINDDPHWQVLDCWVESMVQLFAPQIAWLYQARDKRIEEHKLKNAIENPYMDLELEELSEIHIDLKKQIEWVIG